MAWRDGRPSRTGPDRADRRFDRSGRLDLDPEPRPSGAAATIRHDGTRLTVLAPRERDTVRLDGRLGRGVWEGVVQTATDSSTFRAVRLAHLPAAALGSLVGSYRTSAGSLLGVAPFAEFGSRLFAVDYQSGRIAPLYPLSADRYLAGTAVISPPFPADTLIVDRGDDGGVRSIRFTAATDGPAVRIPTRDEDVTFANGAVTLAGTLTIPEGPGPHPAIVLVHGSNAQPREAFGPWQRFFAAQGHAVLAYDKRGTGRSTGDWRQADFPTLASDVKTAVRFLGGRGEIRKDRIGLWGISQAGWLLPMVAAELPEEVAFLIVHAGTGTTVREQGLLNLRQELRASGLPDTAVEVALELQRLDDIVTETGKGLDKARAYYEAQEPTHPWLRPPSPPDAWFRGYYRTLMGFDPAPWWRRVRAPVLLFFGELDVNVPPPESWPPIERALAAGGNQRVMQHVLPSANHVFFEAKTGAGDEYPGLSKFVPGYFDRMAEWLHSPASGGQPPGASVKD